MAYRKTPFLRWAAVLAAGLGVGQLVSRAHDRAGPPPGSPAPEPALVTLDGASVTLASLKGHVAVLNFWATWCPACKAEMPALARFAAAHRKDCVSLVGVSTEEPATLRSYAAQRPPAYPLSSSSGDLEEKLGVEALPTTVVLDPEGRIAARRVGVLSLEQLEALVQPLLGTSRC